MAVSGYGTCSLLVAVSMYERYLQCSQVLILIFIIINIIVLISFFFFLVFQLYLVFISIFVLS